MSGARNRRWGVAFLRREAQGEGNVSDRAVGVVARYALHARLLWRASPVGASACLGLTFLQAGASTAALVTTGHLVGELSVAVRRPTESAAVGGGVWWRLLATAVAFIAGPVAGTIATTVGRAVASRYLTLTHDLLMDAGLRPYGIAHLEEANTKKRLDAIGEGLDNWLFVHGVESTWWVVAARLGGVGTFIVLATWRWWAPLVSLAGWLVASGSFNRYMKTVFDDLLAVTGNGRRRAAYVHDLLTGRSSAKEVRLFGLGGWLLGQYVATWEAAMTLVWENRQKGLRNLGLAALVGLLTTAVLFGVVAAEAWQGRLSITMLVTLAQAIPSMSGFGVLGDPQSALARNTAVAVELTRVRRQLGLAAVLGGSPSEREGELGKIDVSLPGQGPVAIVAKGVSAGEWREVSRGARVDLTTVTFTYPSLKTPTLEELSLTVLPGETLGIVGLNGVGKSTLIKLLCGLYRPNAGEVVIDGLDPGTEVAGRRRIAIVFQDFVHYPLSLRENVALGVAGGTADQTLLDAALRAAGGERLLAGLARGLDTAISSEYRGGVDLSGGQWQVVALARALAGLRSGAGLLVLDEPTAALDVRTEADLFNRVLDARRGVTTILASHRLSSVRCSDRIVVIGRPPGRLGASVIEEGSHQQLLDANGVYARLFRLQAARFLSSPIK